jgi:ABC-type nickel/cobalt efflux system permease component RcnA
VESSEPYFQIASAVLILSIAVWMLVRTWHLQNQKAESHADPHQPPPEAPGHAHARDHANSHSHSHAPSSADSGLTAQGYRDPHQLAHAADIRRRLGGRQVTTGQIVLFGLTGGLIPCSAAIAVLLMCLQVKQVALGAALVLAFSIGLALTLVLSGAVAALSIRQVNKRWSGFDKFTRRAPYFSGGLIILVGLYVGWHGLRALGY